MIINELFDKPIPPDELIPIQGAAAYDRFGIVSPASAFEFKVKDSEYIAYFLDDKRNVPDCFIFSFAKRNMATNSPIFDVTNDSNALFVFRYIIETLSQFLFTYEPKQVTCSGFSRRQSQFYIKLANSNKLPPPYEVIIENDNVVIVRGETEPVLEQNLTELFDGSTKVVKIDKTRAQAEFSLKNIRAAYHMMLDNENYVFFFVNGGYATEFCYGLVEQIPGNRTIISYDLTNKGVQFKILPAVVQVLLNFIQEYKPETILISGANDRQIEFYNRAGRFLKKKLPPPYEIKRAYGKIVVTKDTDEEDFELFDQ